MNETHHVPAKIQTRILGKKFNYLNNFLKSTGSGDNQIIFGDRPVGQYFLGDSMPGSVENFATFTWHQTCFTWSAASEYEELYLNGQKITQELTPAGSKVPTNGTLVLEQEQDSPGGRFVINEAFGGEIYRLQILKRKLSAKEVEDIYNAGFCAYPSPSEDVVLDWEDFLDAKRYGQVEEISAGCSKWDVLANFVGQQISPDLISYLKRNH